MFFSWQGPRWEVCLLSKCSSRSGEQASFSVSSGKEVTPPLNIRATLSEFGQVSWYHELVLNLPVNSSKKPINEEWNVDADAI